MKAPLALAATRLHFYLRFEVWIASKRLELWIGDLGFVLLLAIFFRPSSFDLWKSFVPKAVLPRAIPSMKRNGQKLRQLRLAVPATSQSYLLQDRRLQKIQGRLVTQSFRRFFGIAVGPAQEQICGRYSSIPWLMGQLARCAGVKLQGQLSMADRSRLQSVFGLFCSLLSLDSRRREEGLDLAPMTEAKALIQAHERKRLELARYALASAYHQRIVASSLELQLLRFERTMDAHRAMGALQPRYRRKSQYLARAIGGWYE